MTTALVTDARKQEIQQEGAFHADDAIVESRHFSASRRITWGELRALLQERTCEWTWIEDDNDWRTGCGSVPAYGTEDGPTTFCHECGGKVNTVTK